MEDKIQSLLRSDKARQHKRAIQLMREHPNDATLSHLAQLAKKDPDDTVRKLAMQLGREIQLAQNPKDEQAIADKREAERILDKALDTMIEGDIAFARQIARKGFQTFPGLRYDVHYREVAADIMQMKAHQAVEHLLGEKDLIRQIKKGKRKSNRQQEPSEGFLLSMRLYLNKAQASWIDILFDMLIYIVAITLPLLVILLAGNALFTIGLNSLQNSPTTPETQKLSLIIAQFAGFDGVRVSLVLTFLFVVSVIIPSLMTFAFQMLLIHVSAIWFLGGDGSFRNLIHRSLLPMISMSSFYWAMLVATPFMYAFDLGWLVDAGLMDIISIVGFFAFIYWFATIVGFVYKMGLGGGCMAMMFPYLVLFGCFCSLITINLARVFFSG